MPIINRVAEFHADIAAWRQHIHANPELLYDVHETAAFVVEQLRSFGVDEVVTGIGRTGVVGVIRGKGDSDRVVGLRADMDALPITERTGKPYASGNSGKMHACGHDGHTAMLLGAARYLAETRNFDGTVIVIFQPAEEGGGGGPPPRSRGPSGPPSGPFGPGGGGRRPPKKEEPKKEEPQICKDLHNAAARARDALLGRVTVPKVWNDRAALRFFQLTYQDNRRDGGVLGALGAIVVYANRWNPAAPTKGAVEAGGRAGMVLGAATYAHYDAYVDGIQDRLDQLSYIADGSCQAPGGG